MITLYPKLSDCFTFFDNSKKNSLARLHILLSLSSKHVAISLIWPLTLTMSFRIRCVSTISVFLRTWLDSSRNLWNKKHLNPYDIDVKPDYYHRLNAFVASNELVTLTGPSWVPWQGREMPCRGKLKTTMSGLDQFFVHELPMVLVVPSCCNSKQTWHRDEKSMAQSSSEIWRSGHQLLQLYSLWWSVEEP